jgi:hypothetical protein
MKKLIPITAVAASVIVSACGGGGAADASAGSTPVVAFAPGVNGDAVVTVTGPDGVGVMYSYRALASMVLY